MSSRPWMTGVLVGMAMSWAACELPPAEVPKERTETAAVPPPSPPPPPVKPCKSLEEGCAATPGKKLRIPETTLTFEPPEGWIYAQGEHVAVARSGDGDLWYGIAGYDADDGRDAKKKAGQRTAALARIGQDLQVTVSTVKIAWDRPEQVEEVGGVKVALWEIEKAIHAGTAGSVVLFAAPLAEGKALLGLAFVPASAPSAAGEVIMRSIKSIASSASP